MRRSVPLSVLLMPLLPLLALAQPREAAALTTACVNTPALLQSALTTAQSNNTDNYIKVVTGSYGLSATVNISIPASYALTVEGGYTAGCASAPTATAYSTTIAGGSGVWIDDTASNYNQVVGNVIEFNGGLAIDLAAQGPTANAGDESSGPNDLLHKPVLTSALEVGGNTVQVTGTITTEAPNTQRYLTVYQNSSCGGDAATMLGTFLLQSGSDSIAHFSVTASHPASSHPIYINATDDNLTAAGITETSEISNSRRIKPLDDIFYYGFDCY